MSDDDEKTDGEKALDDVAERAAADESASDLGPGVSTIIEDDDDAGEPDDAPEKPPAKASTTGKADDGESGEWGDGPEPEVNFRTKLTLVKTTTPNCQDLASTGFEICPVCLLTRADEKMRAIWPWQPPGAQASVTPFQRVCVSCIARESGAGFKFIDENGRPLPEAEQAPNQRKKVYAPGPDNPLPAEGEPGAMDMEARLADSLGTPD